MSFFNQTPKQEEAQKRLEELKEFNPRRLAQAILTDLTSYSEEFSHYIFKEQLDFSEVYSHFISHSEGRLPFEEPFISICYKFPITFGSNNEMPDLGIYASFRITDILEHLKLESTSESYKLNSEQVSLELMRLFGDELDYLPAPRNLNVGIKIIRDLASGYFVLNQGTHFKFGQGNVDSWSIDLRLIQAPDSITDR